MTHPQLPLAYIGPESALPVASILAAMLGGLLMFWNLIWGYLKRGFRSLTGRRNELRLPPDAPAASSEPAASS